MMSDSILVPVMCLDAFGFLCKAEEDIRVKSDRDQSPFFCF